MHAEIHTEPGGLHDRPRSPSCTRTSRARADCLRVVFVSRVARRRCLSARNPGGLRHVPVDSPHDPAGAVDRGRNSDRLPRGHQHVSLRWASGLRAVAQPGQPGAAAEPALPVSPRHAVGAKQVQRRPFHGGLCRIQDHRVVLRQHHPSRDRLREQLWLLRAGAARDRLRRQPVTRRRGTDRRHHRESPVSAPRLSRRHVPGRGVGRVPQSRRQRRDSRVHGHRLGLDRHLRPLAGCGATQW